MPMAPSSSHHGLAVRPGRAPSRERPDPLPPRAAGRKPPRPGLPESLVRGASMRRIAFVDEVAASAAFSSGDVVRKTSMRDFVLSPYAGRVLYSSPKTGKVMVQWPWGSEQESPHELVKDLSGDYAPPIHNSSYSTW